MYLDDSVLCSQFRLRFLIEGGRTNQENSVEQLEKLDRVQNPEI